MLKLFDMIATMIICAALAATAAAFAVLFFMTRKNSDKNEKKSEELTLRLSELNDELSDLRVEHTRAETKAGIFQEPLDRSSLAEFLRKEKGTQVQSLDDSDYVIFTVDDSRYYFDCSQLPRFLWLGIRNRLDADSNYHVDVMDRAATFVTDSIHMVKVTVVENDYFGFHITSTDRTVGTLRENFDTYMSILEDSRRAFASKYWEIMKVEHPEECVEEDEAGTEGDDPSSMEELAMRMAGASMDPKLRS